MWRDGEATSIRTWDVTTELADDGVTHRVSHVRATDKRAARTSCGPTSCGSTACPTRPATAITIVNEGLARWTYEGRTGYGISEYLHQLDDDGVPLVPIE